MRTLLIVPFSLSLLGTAQAQVFLSQGSYAQDFDGLALSGSANAWLDNNTIAGWYAAAAAGFGGDYRAGAGTGTTGDLYSFGSEGSSDRALGSLASGTTGPLAYGLRLKNDTPLAWGSVTIQYVGEQWRNNGNTSPQQLLFGYRVATLELVDPDPGSAHTWTMVPSLDFESPVTGASAVALDGNAPENRLVRHATIEGLVLQPGEELFLRWLDPNDSGNDHALAVDDLAVTLEAVPEPGSLLLAAACLGAIGAQARRLLNRREKRFDVPPSEP